MTKKSIYFDAMAALGGDGSNERPFRNFAELHAVEMLSDAARYRYLRDRGGGSHTVVNGELLQGMRLDEEIDRVIKHDCLTHDHRGPTACSGCAENGNQTA